MQQQQQKIDFSSFLLSRPEQLEPSLQTEKAQEVLDYCGRGKPEEEGKTLQHNRRPQTVNLSIQRLYEADSWALNCLTPDFFHMTHKFTSYLTYLNQKKIKPIEK